MSIREILTTDNLLLVISLIGILLVVAMLMLLREQKRAYYTALFVPREETSVTAPQQTDIEGALKFLDEIQDKPELMEKVGEYARQAMAASLLQRLSILSGAIAVLENKARYNTENHLIYRTEAIRKEITKLQQEQIALTQLAESFSSSHSMA